MVLYIIIIVALNVVLALVNALCFGPITVVSFFITLGWCALATVSVILVDGIFALIVRRLFPAKLFAPEVRFFHVSEKERKFLKKIKIASWKDKIPELGGFTAFHKDKVRDKGSSEYLKRFIVESNYGLAIHYTGMVFGFLIMLIPFWNPFTISLPIAIINIPFNLVSALILRYNLPPLHYLYGRAVKREQRAATESESEPKTPSSNGDGTETETRN